MLIAADQRQAGLDGCVESVGEHTPPGTPTLTVEPNSAAVNQALEQLAPADVVLISEPCIVAPGWLAQLRDAARGDSNTATASALADRDTDLAPFQDSAGEDAGLADGLSERTLGLCPRLRRAVGPCVYIRREALELVGQLDEELELRWALEVDFAQRCLLSGLAHVAADDVLVRLPASAHRAGLEEMPSILAERYPYVAGNPAVGDSHVLTLALEAARGRRSRLSVTIDASALDGAITGTHVHVLELIRALAHTDQLQLRVLVREQRIDRAALELLDALPQTEILAFERLDASTPKSTVFHRPQQTFSASDVALALTLGERFVLSQLDLIAYRNPGYFADADAWEDYRRAGRHGLSAAERVVVFSEHTRRELLADALVEDTRVRVVPPGLDHHAAVQPQRPAFGGEGRDEPPSDGFLLCLGTDFRHKNRVFALRLLGALREHHDWQGSLVLAGTHIPLGSSLELERDYLDEHPELRAAVVTLGPVSESEKAWLLAHAGAVVYPSAYEGFGLVPFESAQSGVPCLFAAQSSLAEEAPAQTAAIVPWDAEASANAAHALLSDPDARAAHLQALTAAAQALTWEACARAMVQLYREAALAPVRDAATLSRDLVVREQRLSVEHKLEAARLIGEREHAQRMYDELVAEVGDGLSLIGPRGTLPDGLQRALLSLSARPAIAGPLFTLLSRSFVVSRSLARLIRALPRPRR